MPRETGAWMAVFADGAVGTIGGGHLEYEAIAEARARWPAQPVEAERRSRSGRRWASAAAAWCCLRFERLQPPMTRCAAVARNSARAAGGPVRRRPRRPRAGAGAGARCRLRVTWIDSRDGIFPAELPANVALRAFRSGAGRGADLAPQLARADHELQPRRRPGHRGRLPEAPARARRPALHRPDRQQDQVGDLPPPAARRAASATAELAQVTCPIGLPGIAGKEPEVIAVAVAAQLLQQRHASRAG